MKKIFALAALALLATTCGGDEGDRPASDNWFLPLSVSVDGTSADVRCLTLVGSDALKASTAGFVYGPAGGGADASVTVTEVEKNDGVLSCRLEGLPEKTLFAIRAFILLGDRRLESGEALFETGTGGSDPDPGPGPGPDPGPVFDNPDLSLYSGWAELPGQTLLPDDYYFARHYCPGSSYPGGAPVRNYTICYSAAMRGPVWVAYPLHDFYSAGSVGRSSWRNDPSIPRAVQPDLTGGSYQPQPGFSRGHMIASNDRQRDKAMNEQTFYVTNSSPQRQDRFNGSIWGSLELACWRNVCADTLYVVTGAWFGDSFELTADKSGRSVSVPSAFYKVLLRSRSGRTGRPLSALAADELQCTGFWFEHKDYPSGARPAQYMTSVADIERRTGMKFFVNVPQAPKETFDAADWSF